MWWLGRRAVVDDLAGGGQIRFAGLERDADHGVIGIAAQKGVAGEERDGVVFGVGQAERAHHFTES